MATTAEKIKLPLPIDGIRRDLEEHDIPPTALTTAQNWILRDGRLQLRPGLTPYGHTVSERPTGYTAYAVRTFNMPAGEVVTPRPVKATTRGWYVWDQSVERWIDVTDPVAFLHGTDTTHQVFRQFQRAGIQYLLGCNHEDIPRKWDGMPANVFAEIEAGGTAAPIARCMCITGDRLLLGNLRSGANPYSYAVDVSAFQDFDAGWGATETALLIDTPGAITSMNELSTLQSAIYKEDAIYVASLQSGLTPIRFELRQADIDGPPNPACVMPIPGGPHVYLSHNGDVLSYDGLNLSPLPASDAFRKLFDELADRNGHILLKAFGAYDARHRELRFWFAETGEFTPNLALMINMRNQSVWLERHPNNRFTAATYIKRGLTSVTDFLPRLFIGRNDGQTFLLTGESDAGFQIPHFFETGMYDLTNGTRYKHVPEIEHFFKSGTNPHSINIQLGISKSGETRVLTAMQQVLINANTQGPYVTGHRQDARFISMRLSGTGPGTVPVAPTPEYFSLTDQNGIPWFYWLEANGAIVRSPAAPGGSFTNSSEASPLQWYQVENADGLDWYIHPDVDGTLLVSSVAPAGSGWDIGTGKVLHTEALSPVWHLGIGSGPNPDIEVSIELLLEIPAFEALQWRGSMVGIVPRGLR